MVSTILPLIRFSAFYKTRLLASKVFLHKSYIHSESGRLGCSLGRLKRPLNDRNVALFLSGIIGLRFILNSLLWDCQVVGELSNCGSPMRRFMQTFVLAPQSAKKYYLHNDIFRYQDEVFADIAAAEVDCSGEEIYGLLLNCIQIFLKLSANE